MGLKRPPPHPPPPATLFSPTAFRVSHGDLEDGIECGMTPLSHARPCQTCFRALLPLRKWAASTQMVRISWGSLVGPFRAGVVGVGRYLPGHRYMTTAEEKMKQYQDLTKKDAETAERISSQMRKIQRLQESIANWKVCV